MEIQSFLLAEKVHMKGHRFDVENAALANMDCTPETEFPLRFTLPALLLLRRDSWAGHAPFSLCFTLVDEDGAAAGRPNRWLCRGVFPPGTWFARLMAKIAFEFPAPGRYRLDITSDEGLTGAVYHYNISILERVE
jgi:hypothetical protein